MPIGSARPGMQVNLHCGPQGSQDGNASDHLHADLTASLTRGAGHWRETLASNKRSAGAASRKRGEGVGEAVQETKRGEARGAASRATHRGNGVSRNRKRKRPRNRGERGESLASEP